jgi:hypothetical protein
MIANQTLILLEDTVQLSHPVIQAVCCMLGPATVHKFAAEGDLQGFTRILLVAPPDAGKLLFNFILGHLPQMALQPVGLINLSQTPTEPAWLPDAVALLGCSGQNAASIPADDGIGAVIEYCLSFRMKDHRTSDEIDEDELRTAIESFLQTHNTCTLATCYHDQARATTLEYRYRDGHITCVSEGGEKFAGLLRGGQVSMVVHEPYRGKDYLAGLQLFGRARVLVDGSEKYWKLMQAWDITPEMMDSFPCRLHGIDIHLQEAIFLLSGFKEKGFGIRQVYRFL